LFDCALQLQHQPTKQENEMQLRIEEHISNGKHLFFVASGKGSTYKAHGVATNAKAAKQLKSTIRKEMSLLNACNT